MASLLDVSLLSYFQNIFVILFVFVASYIALLIWKPFGDEINKGIAALLAMTMALIFFFSPQAVEVVRSTIPWYVVMMIVLMFVVIVTRSFGVEAMPASLMRSMPTWILIIGIIIFVINVSLQLGQSAGPYLGNSTINPDNVQGGGEADVGSGSFSTNFSATLFHPKVLAMLLVLVIFLFAVLFIGYTPSIPV